MKQIVLIYMCLLSLNIFCQKKDKLIGTWIKKDYPKKGIAFSESGEFTLFEIESNNLKSSNEFYYRIIKEKKFNYLWVYTLKNGVEIQILKDKFKVNKKKLFLPIRTTENGITTIDDYKDVYIRKTEN
jgi:hypothetical protein